MRDQNTCLVYFRKGNRIQNAQTPLPKPMNTSTDTRTQPTLPQTMAFDRILLLEIVQRRTRQWLGLGILIFILLFVCLLFFFPLNYTSTVSLALQQSTTVSNPLAMIASGGMGNRRFTGVLLSRAIADQVEKEVHVQQRCGLRTHDDAVQMLSDALKIDDNMQDGLMYINVSLKGPPRFGPNSESRRRQVAQIAAETANAYASAFRYYLVTSDTDKEAVLRRMAEVQVKRAREAYDNSVQQMVRFAMGRGVSDGANPKAEPSSTGDPSGSEGNPPPTGGRVSSGNGGSGLQQLYAKRAELEIEMRSTEVGQEGIHRLLTLSMDDMLKLPPEDPLLSEERDRVNSALRRVQTLQVQYGEDNPQVVNAQAKYQQERTHLQDQIHAILNGNTTTHVRQLQLVAEYDVVTQQIKKAERGFKKSRDSEVQYERLRAEVSLSLEALKTFGNEYAKMQMQIPAAQSRMKTIDEAIPARRGSPGILIQGLISLLGALAGIGLLMGVEYARCRMRDARMVMTV